MTDISKIKSPFKTPEGYFDSIESRVMKNISVAKEEKISVWQAFRRVLLPYAAAVAVFAGFYFAIRFNSGNPADVNETSSAVAVTDWNTYYDIYSSPLEEWESAVWQDPLGTTEDNFMEYSDEDLYFMAEKLNNLDLILFEEPGYAML